MAPKQAKSYKHGVLAQIVQEGLRTTGMTQRDLAERLGVKQQTVSKWANGESRPPPARIPELGAALRASEETLMVAAGYQSARSGTATAHGGPVALNDEEAHAALEAALVQVREMEQSLKDLAEVLRAALPRASRTRR